MYMRYVVDAGDSINSDSENHSFTLKVSTLSIKPESNTC